MGAEESVIQPGALSLRMSFDDFTGLFVMHCHRLNHEDNGLMALVNVIPAVSTYAVAVARIAKGHAAEVKVYDGNGDRLLATVTPFPDFEGTPSVAMGDVDDDGVYDLVVGAGKDHAPEVVAYSGKAVGGKGAFATELARFTAFAPTARGGVSVTVDADRRLDLPTTSSSARVPASRARSRCSARQLPSSPGTAPALFSTFNPYPNDHIGRERHLRLCRLRHRPEQHRHRSRTRQPGAGEGLRLLADDANRQQDPAARRSRISVRRLGDPAMTAAFMPFGTDYRDGVSLATGWLTGSIGGAEADRRRPADRPRRGEGLFERFGAARRPGMYLDSAMAHSPIVEFTEAANFEPFDGASGVSVATTSTTTGADLLVSGVSPQDKTAEVRKYQFVRPTPDATMLQPVQLGEVVSAAGSLPDVARRRLSESVSDEPPRSSFARAFARAARPRSGSGRSAGKPRCSPRRAR